MDRWSDSIRLLAMGPRTVPTRMMHQTLTLQFSDRGRITAQAIPREDARRAVVWIRQGLLQEHFRGFAVACLRQIEIHGLPVAVDGPEQVQPTPGNPNEGLIDMPRGKFWFDVSPQPPLYFRCIPLHPTPDGGLVHRQAAFRHQLFQISQTEGKLAVPTHAGHDNDRFKLTPPEQRRPAGPHA